MKKNKPKEKTKSKPDSRLSSPAPNQKLIFALTFFFFVLSLVGIFHHEMWRDEHQAWLVAKDAHSLPQLFANVKYEGNPALWHLCLFVVSFFTTNPFGMQLFHAFVATGFVFIFLKYSPFGFAAKIPFLFGYFIFYEYALISRGYGLGVLFAFLACVFYEKRFSNPLRLGMVLFFLANTSIYGLLISLALTGVVTLEYLFVFGKYEFNKWKLISGLAIAIVGLGLSLVQILPEPDNTFPVIWAEGFDTNRLYFSLWKLVTSYFAIPDFDKTDFWNTNVFIADEQAVMNPLIPIMLFLFCAIIFFRKPFVLLFYAGCTIGLIFLFYQTLLVHARYCGHLFIVLLVSFWISHFYGDFSFRKNSLNSISSFGKKMSVYFLMLTLFLSSIGGLTAWFKDFKLPFSTSEKAAKYLSENNLQNLTIVGTSDFIMSPLSTYLQKNIFFPERNAFGSFIIWDKKRNDTINFLTVVSSLLKFIENGENKVVLILENQPTYVDKGQKQNMEHVMLSEDVRLDLVKYIPPGVVKDEKYYIFIAEKNLQSQ